MTDNAVCSPTLPTILLLAWPMPLLLLLLGMQTAMVMATATAPVPTLATVHGHVLLPVLKLVRATATAMVQRCCCARCCCRQRSHGGQCQRRHPSFCIPDGAPTESAVVLLVGSRSPLLLLLSVHA